MAAWKPALRVGLLAMMAQLANAAPATDAMISEIGAALDGGDAAHAQRLSETALADGSLTGLQRGRLLLDRGLAHELQGANTDALADFTAALQTHALPSEEHAQALLQRGFLRDGLNRLDEAVKDYTAVIAMKSALAPTALNNRANIYRRMNKLAEARRDYLAALAAGTAKPEFPYYGLGQIAEAQHDTDAARGFYAKAVASNPGYQLASDRLEVLGRPTEATLNAPDQIVLHVAKAATRSPAQTVKPILRRPPAHAVTNPELSLRPTLDGDSSRLQVQLGAWRSEAEARAAWTRARAKAEHALRGFDAQIVRAEVPGRGTYFRLRLDAADPTALCARLKASGLDCLPVRQ